MNVLDHTKAHQKYFEEMSKIPHGSFHEKAFSNYLVEFAKSHQLRYVQDDIFNVVIYKDGSTGYVDHPPVLLQAHMDMVCEKNKDVTFDFEHDALALYLEDGWVKAKGTTLGADDGSGVAYMLAILSSTTLLHPPLECAFTVQEEVGLFGALALKPEYFQAKRFINLDDGGEKSTCTTSAGGVNVILRRSIVWEASQCPAYELQIKGLFGGHSGGEIDKERGNANSLLARVLYHIHDIQPIQLGHVDGGLKDNAIPREALAIFTSDLPKELLMQEINDIEEEIQKELEFSDAGITIQLVETSCSRVMKKELSEAYLKCVYLLPNGVHHKSMSIEGLTTASMNVGIVRCDDDVLMINCSIRGALESYFETIAEKVEIIAGLLSFATHREAYYPAWSYDATSEMRETLQRVFMDLYNEPLSLVAVHGGLECGVFKAMDAAMDIVTMGPIMKDIHTPKERMSLESFDRTYTLLCAYLEKL